jgi:hypothetical protein
MIAERALAIFAFFGELEAPLQVVSGNSTIIVLAGALGTAITRWMSWSSSSFISTKRADHPTEERMGFERLCNRLIHHFAFVLRMSADEQNIEIFFNSEDTDEQLWLISLSRYRAIVEEVAYDEATWEDSNREEGRVILRRRRPDKW